MHDLYWPRSQIRQNPLVSGQIEAGKGVDGLAWLPQLRGNGPFEVAMVAFYVLIQISVNVLKLRC